MKKPSASLLPVLLSSALALSASPLSAERENPVPPAAPPAEDAGEKAEPEMVWHTDPTCQFVFFAILEGLYTDGVPSEVVDLIIPKDEGLQHSFVFRCELCHAAFEAFSLYQKRAAFAEADDVSSFKKEDEKFAGVIEELKSDRILERLQAMGGLVRGWIDRRMETQRLTADERTALLTAMVKFADAGNDKFLKLRNNPDTVYFQWQFYDGCQACKAAEILAREEKAKE